MIDLAAIDQQILLARGEYSTLNGEQKRLLAQLRETCSALTSVGPQIHQYMQPRAKDTPETGGALGLVSYARDVVEKMEVLIMELDEIDAVKNVLKKSAWG